MITQEKITKRTLFSERLLRNMQINLHSYRAAYFRGHSVMWPLRTRIIGLIMDLKGLHHISIFHMIIYTQISCIVTCCFKTFCFDLVFSIPSINLWDRVYFKLIYGSEKTKINSKFSNCGTSDRKFDCKSSHFI